MQVQDQLKLKSPYALVAVKDLKDTNYRGNITIELAAPQNEELSNETIQLYDGVERCNTTIIVHDNKVTFSDVAVGGYTLKVLTATQTPKYEYSPHHVIVFPGNNVITVAFTPKINTYFHESAAAPLPPNTADQTVADKSNNLAKKEIIPSTDCKPTYTLNQNVDYPSAN